jgi:hypothetical protein
MPPAGAIYERDLNGTLVRTFTAAGIDNISGVTRGPNGHVYATSSLESRIYHWNMSGSLQGSTLTSANFTYGAGIAWAGNVPEPASASILLMAGAGGLLARRSRRQPRRLDAGAMIPRSAPSSSRSRGSALAAILRRRSCPPAVKYPL